MYSDQLTKLSIKFTKLYDDELNQLISKYINNENKLSFIFYYQKVYAIDLELFLLNYNFHQAMNNNIFNHKIDNLIKLLHLYGIYIPHFKKLFFKLRYSNLNNNKLKNIIEI